MTSTVGPRSPRRVTIHDVAKACGVAPSTVSRALSRPGRINPETAQRIAKVAEELGYRSATPSALAGRATEARRIVLLSVPDLTNPVFAEVARGAQETAMALDYTVQLADFQESPRLERLAVERSLPGVDGVLMVASRMPDSALRVIAQSKPVVLLSRAVASIPSVVTDDTAGMRSAVEHLYELGHDRIVYLSGPEASWASGVRWLALREVTEQMGIKARRLGPFVPTLAGGLRAAEQLLARPASAVIAFNDQLAAGLIKGLSRAGIGVPTDVSVVGFDNTIVAALIAPGLTSVATPRREQGAAGTRHLIARIGGDATAADRPGPLPTRLSVRTSTAPRRSDPVRAWTASRQAAARAATRAGRGLARTALHPRTVPAAPAV